ncbi:ThiF family adenylyltransferase, partial [Mycobacterium tuberculosis]|uniref:ThiF family adenylyltransferase n=1 Tax=Mycobacterium tuberculosis TaxID=1773 RepID=UPI0004D7521C
MSTPPWAAEFPGRLEYELTCLEAAGIRYAVDDGAMRLGVMQLRVAAIGDLSIDLTVTFPDLYPFVRPSVRLAAEHAEPMAHHAHPFSGDLCLIGRSTALWHTDDTLAWLLTTQLPKTLQAGQITATSADEVEALTGVEEAQAEPWTDYYSCFDEGSMILVDSGWTLPTTSTEGTLGLRLHRLNVAGVDAPQPVGLLHGAVFTVGDGRGQVLCSLSGQNPDRFPLPVAGRWARLDAPVRGDTPEAFLTELRRAAPRLLDGAWQPAPVDGWELQIFGLTFPEERVHRGTGDGWVFLLRLRQTGGRPQQQPKRGRGQRSLPPAPARTTTHVIRAGYAGQPDMAARVPELTGLHNRHVAVFGVGALGSTVTEHLARAGIGQLTVVDRDHLEPGNLVRHAARLDMAGWSKAFAASQIALSIAPNITVNVIPYAIGAPRTDPQPDHRNEIDAWTEAIDK